MELIFMGTGTSQGVPMIAFDNHKCDLKNPKNWRTRTSAHITAAGLHFQIDAAPEFRLQCIANNIRRVDYFILTHGHSDHVMGMDDLRRFCDMRDSSALDVFSTDDGLDRIAEIYPYAIMDKPRYKGYPAFRLHLIQKKMDFPGVTLHTTLLPHGSLQVLGLVFHELATGEKLAYYTDCKELPPEARHLAQGVNVLVIDALRYEEHPTHLSLSDALAVSRELQAKKTYLTHMTHHMDYEKLLAELPENVSPAYDGLVVTCAQHEAKTSERVAEV
jgi:phosphoribosyl 1,2-cyclic phosphate phosphodiesterase